MNGGSNDKMAPMVVHRAWIWTLKICVKAKCLKEPCFVLVFKVQFLLFWGDKGLQGSNYIERLLQQDA